MRLIAQIEGEEIIEHDDLSVTYRSKAAIDSDGSDDHSHDDPWYQNDTSLHQDGSPLGADHDKYIVVPPAIIQGVKGVVLGAQAKVFNRLNGKSTDAVVGDIGPHHKLGEISCATAEALGIDPNPKTGGESRHVIDYTIWPGTPAQVDGKAYVLQPHRS